MGFTPSQLPAQGEHSDENELTPEQSEAQMRRALETLSAGAPARNNGSSPPTFGRLPAKKSAGFTAGPQRKHRFVQDGEVQVVHLSLPKERPKETAPTPDTDPRATRERTERSLQDAQTMLRGLQTKLAHTEIALSEAVQRANVQIEAANNARAELNAARAEARAAEQARASLEHRMADQRASLEAEIDRLRLELEEARAAPPPPPAPPPAPVKPPPAPVKVVAQAPKTRKPRVKRVEVPEVEPEPVKWWLNTKPAARGKRSGKPG